MVYSKWSADLLTRIAVRFDIHFAAAAPTSVACAVASTSDVDVHGRATVRFVAPRRSTGCSTTVGAYHANLAARGSHAIAVTGG